MKLIDLKNWMFFVALFLLVFSGYSQQRDTTPPFKKFPFVPPITLLKSDSTRITKEGLKKNQPVIIMFFSPGCDHCQRQVEDMLKRINDLKKIQIILATYEPLEELKKFEKKYKLKKYPNIQSGRDTKYMMQPFYRINKFPYLALYNKKGNLITTYEGNVKVETLIEELR